MDTPALTLLEAGTKTWRNFLNMVGRLESTATNRITVGQLSFYDGIIEVWAKENLGAITDGRDRAAAVATADGGGVQR